ncbi:MAG: hypothetical protein M1830_001690 [Pleopsidium flavum]|nr:MAG: hypothetical protein M1830_001690 [Pleopsidium flavum]
MRPYNFYLNPVMEERLDVERVFSYQSGAVEFLLSHRFRMEAPFLEGVPYLSRDEERLARRQNIARQDRFGFGDIQLKSDDFDSIDFVRRVRQEIHVWRSSNTEEPDFLNISPFGHATQFTNTRGLNNFQKRLVHQLVRAEYPDLVTVSRPTFIQIIRYDGEREDAIRKTKSRRFEEQISRQIGLRWLVEAMVDGDLSSIDPRSFARSVIGEPVFVDPEATSRHFDQIKDQLKGHRTVLVGHNMFTDLVNFYKCFLGQLPDRVEDFQRTMHKLFPMIIDTKYLATHNCGSISPKSSLEEIEEDLREMFVPLIETHFEHLKYSTTQAPHEAGYDSFLTAKVLIRLSAQLEGAGIYVKNREPSPLSDEELYHTAPEEGGVSLDLSRALDKNSVGKKVRVPKDHKSNRVDSNPQGVSLDGTNGDQMPSTQNIRSRARKLKRAAKKAMKPSAFSHATRFDLLGDMSSGEEQRDHSIEATLTTSPDNFHLIMEDKSQQQLEPKTMTMMPHFESDFWSVYGNKLRVFGTVENVCDLTAF